MNYRKIMLHLFACFLLTVSANSQDPKLDKAMIKIQTLLESNKVEKATKKLEKVLVDNPHFAEGWDLMADIRLHYYQQAKTNGGIRATSFTVTTTDQDGNEIESEEGNLLAAMLAGISPSTRTYSEYITTLRKGTLLAPDAYKCAIMLRSEKRDVNVDSLVSDEAWNLYNKAEKEFGNRNYNDAAKLYQEALAVEPDFYKAALYLADSYYVSGVYEESSKYFKECIDRFPDALEPRKYLTDSYAQSGYFDLALEQAIESMLIYPDISMQAKLRGISSRLGKEVVVEKFQRKVFPNRPNKINGLLINPTEEYWNYYIEVAEDVSEFTDESGIITSENDITSATYLEVFSWEQMLSKSNSPDLKIARELHTKGYLDCYVLVTNFHDDLYEQYTHFAKNNKEKIRKYYNEVVVPSN